jgi:general L-amino acid transport system permease protein
MDTNNAFVRHTFLPAEAAPRNESTIIGWLRKNLFATLQDTILTLVAIAAILYFLPGVIDWLFISAVWTGADRSVCTTAVQGGIQPEGWSGACWAYVNDRFVQFMFGSYPRGELWRPLLVLFMFIGLLIPFLIPKAPRKGLNALLLLIALPIVAYVLLLGGSFGLAHV